VVRVWRIFLDRPVNGGRSVFVLPVQSHTNGEGGPRARAQTTGTTQEGLLSKCLEHTCTVSHSEFIASLKRAPPGHLNLYVYMRILATESIVLRLRLIRYPPLCGVLPVHPELTSSLLQIAGLVHSSRRDALAHQKAANLGPLERTKALKETTKKKGEIIRESFFVIDTKAQWLRRCREIHRLHPRAPSA